MAGACSTGSGTLHDRERRLANDPVAVVTKGIVVNLPSNLIDGVRIVAAIATVIAATTSWSSASQAKRAADETRKAATSALLASLVLEYQSNDMMMALQRMGELQRSKGLLAILKEARDQISQTIEINNARRNVHWFYKKIWLLHKSGALDRLQVKILIHNTYGFELWADFVLPLSKAIEPSPDMFDWYRWTEDFLREFKG
jgi:hypothetical protein